MIRNTLVVANQYAWHMGRFAAAQVRAQGLQILTMSGLASRLAGGFCHEASREQLHTAIRLGLDRLSLQELEPLRDMPGGVPAVSATLRKVWAADIDLKALAPQSKRIAEIFEIESFVRANLPVGCLTTPDLKFAAVVNARFAYQVIGPVTIKNILTIEPCWHAMLKALAEEVAIEWQPPRASSLDTNWLKATKISTTVEPPLHPTEATEVCANPNHEVVEALRWARELITTARALPHEIAITACSIEDWDDECRVLVAESQLPIFFIQGHRALSTYPGQQVAALAELLITGLSHDRVVRSLRLLTGTSVILKELPSTWYKMLPKDAPLLRREHWDAVLAAIADRENIDLRPVLGRVLDLLDVGIRDSHQIPNVGEELLRGPALALWRRALVEGPPSALQSTLKELRFPDDKNPEGCVVWGPAEAIVGAPRPFVRMLGLTSRHWPRRSVEDSLLPSHIMASRLLESVSVPERDRAAFDALQCSAKDVTYSRSRRDREGRLLGISPLLNPDISTKQLSRTRVTQHAFNECDRLLARRSEFAATEQGQSSRACDEDWRSPRITVHDGLVVKNHPAIIQALHRLYSATALARLITDPIGFIWSYALNWKAPESTVIEEPLTLDKRTFGNLVHEILSNTVQALEASGGFASAPVETITKAAEIAAEALRPKWEIDAPVPPLRAWEQTLARARIVAVRALTCPMAKFEGQHSFAEVEFGGYTDGKSDLWDTKQVVAIADCGINLAGRIDRIDLNGSRTRARVIDYKTGKCPDNDPGIEGGKSLQRCIYALAVRSLMPSVREISAALLYPGDTSEMFTLDNLDAKIDEVKKLIRLAQTNLLDGRAIFGVGAESKYNDLDFAFPAASKYVYFPRKQPNRNALIGELSEFWEKQ